MNICAATRAARVRSARISTTAWSRYRRRPANLRSPHPRRILRRRLPRSRPKRNRPRRRRSPERMDMSSTPLTPDAHAVERLSYAFAKRHGVISARQLEAGFELWVRPGVRAGVLAEVQRALGGARALWELAGGALAGALGPRSQRGGPARAATVHPPPP